MSFLSRLKVRGSLGKFLPPLPFVGGGNPKLLPPGFNQLPQLPGTPNIFGQPNQPMINQPAPVMQQEEQQPVIDQEQPEINPAMQAMGAPQPVQQPVVNTPVRQSMGNTLLNRLKPPSFLRRPVQQLGNKLGLQKPAAQIGRALGVPQPIQQAFGVRQPAPKKISKPQTFVPPME